MTITVVNAVSNIEIGRNIYTPTNYDGVALPGGLANGDTVILFVRSNNCQLNTPAGYTLLNTVTTASGGSTTIRLYVFKKNTVLATDSGTTLTVVATTSGNPSIWYSSVALRSSDGRFPFIDAQTVVTDNGSSLTVPMPSITATYASELVLVGYSNTLYNTGSYVVPSGLTEITASGTRLASVFYQTLAQGQSTTAGSLGWTGGGANVGAEAVILRFDLLPLQGTLTDTFGSTDALGSQWSLAAALSQSIPIADSSLLGRSYEGTADDTFSLGTETRWINPLFSYVNVSDTFGVARTVDYSVAAGSLIDLAQSVPMYQQFSQVSIPSGIASVSQAYSAWALELGVADMGTDAGLSTTMYGGAFLELDFPPLYTCNATKIFIGASGQINFFRNDPATDYQYTYSSWVYNGIGWNFGPVWPTTTFPILSIGSFANNYGTTIPVFRMRNGRWRSSGPPIEDSIIYYEHNAAGEVVAVAIRLRPGYLEIISNGLYTVSSPSYQHKLQYLLGNDSNNSYGGSRVLVSNITSTLTRFITRDLSVNLRSVVEELAINDPATVGWTARTALTDESVHGDAMMLAWGTVLSQATSISDFNSWEIKYGALLTDALRMIDTHALQGKFATTQSDTIKLVDALIRVFPVDQAETIAVQDVAQTLLGVRVLEALGLLDSPLPKATLYKTVAELLRVSDALRRFLSGDAVDTIGVAHTQTVKYNILRQLAETLGIADALSNKLMIRVDLAENVEVISSELLHTIFNGVIAEGVKISAAYLRPGDNVTTWVVNTMTGATTEYSNYNFNSFAQIGHKYLGASTAGLFELNGDDDAGTDIIAHLKGGFAQFNGSRYTGFKAAYLGMRGTGEFFFKLDAGDGNTYTYKIVAQDMQTTKVQLGKGLRARYFAYELISTGQDFDLDSIEFVPMLAQRRV